MKKHLQERTFTRKERLLVKKKYVKLFTRKGRLLEGNTYKKKGTFGREEVYKKGTFPKRE